MNDAMQLVAKGWYHLYWAVILGISIAVVAGYILTSSVPSLAHLQGTFGLGTTALILASLQIFYSLTVYWMLRRRWQPLALSLSSMLSSLLLLYGVGHSTDIGVWVYIGAWLVSLLFIGMYGLSLVFGSLLVAVLFVMLQTDFQPSQVSQTYWIFLGGSSISAILGYIFWRTRYTSSEKAEVSQLSGMLRNKQQQSATLIQSLTDGVIVTDTQYKINLINPAAAQLTGWSIEDAASVDARLVAKLSKENGEEISEDDNPFTTVLMQQKPLSQTLRLTSRDNKQHVISLAISPVVANGTMTGTVAVMRDISQEYAAEQQRAEFISTASHEMRTPVAAIEGYLALALNEKVSTIDSRAKNYLEKAHSSTQHLGKLFQDLLTSAKAEDGRLSSHPTAVEVGSFLEQLVEDFKLTAQNKGLIAEFVVGESQTIDATSTDASLKVVKPLYYVHADPDRLREVLTNLFDNAVKYTDQGKITIGLTGDDNVVQMYVSDTGPGIPADDIPHLFQKFYRVDSSATRVVGGTGLGLFICRKIIELYNGRIWVQSELGKGSTFYINLPRITTQRAEQIKASDATQQNIPTPTMPKQPSSTPAPATTTSIRS